MRKKSSPLVELLREHRCRQRVNPVLSSDRPRVVDSYAPPGLRARTWKIAMKDGPRDLCGYELGDFWIVKGSASEVWTVLGDGGRQLIGHAPSLPIAVGVVGWLGTPRVAGRDS